MLVTQMNLLDYLSNPLARFVIPSYQRIYSWNERQCEEFIADAIHAQNKEKDHFIGSVLTCKTDQANNGIATLELVDGQQRIITTILLLAAFKQYLEEALVKIDHNTLDDLPAPSALENTYLKIANREENASSAYTNKAPLNKIKLSHYDNDDFEALMATPMTYAPIDLQDESGEVNNSFSNVIHNFQYFLYCLRTMDTTELVTLWNGIKKLYLIDIQLDDKAQAQQIFESLNSKGVALNVADLVRNYLLLSENHDEQTRLYEEYWTPIQEMFMPDPASLKLDSAIKGWLAIRVPGSRIRSAEQTYSSFKNYVEEGLTNTKESLLKELRGFCVMWAENYRYHAVKKFKSSYDWAINGGATLTANRPLKKATNEEYARKLREQLKSNAIDSRW